jgi:cbb3-type cytochrome oxidase subunit 1
MVCPRRLDAVACSGLAAAYYVVPKVTGKALPSYEFAPHAFWCLLLLGAFTGGRHLVGGTRTGVDR